MRKLTGRQCEVLLFVAKGLRNGEIAIQLGVSERSIKACISQLFLIFDVSNRTELVGALVEDGVSDLSGLVGAVAQTTAGEVKRLALGSRRDQSQDHLPSRKLLSETRGRDQCRNQSGTR
jgi:DNA-binding CsgD family transcriptional regulator